MPTVMLSPNFSLAELCHSDTATACGIDNTPDAAAIEQLTLLANETLEKIRKLCGDHPLLVTSGFRCAELNDAVGGAPESAHLFGGACDFSIPNFGDVTTICKTIEPYLAQFGIDQLIDESGGGGSWVHVGRAAPGETPRCECWTIDENGSNSGFV